MDVRPYVRTSVPRTNAKFAKFIIASPPRRKRYRPKTNWRLLIVKEGLVNVVDYFKQFQGCQFVRGCHFKIMQKSDISRTGKARI